MPVLVFPSQVRAQVLEQHAELRGLLVRVSAEASPAAESKASAERLAGTARHLCARFAAHLTFEEEELGRILTVLDAWGPERLRELHVDHRRQRGAFDALLARIDSGVEIEALATALRGLALTLLQDMEEEEEGCLQASSMLENSLPFERSQ